MVRRDEDGKKSTKMEPEKKDIECVTVAESVCVLVCDPSIGKEMTCILQKEIMEMQIPSMYGLIREVII